jgi:hypothetical protein
VQAFTCVGVPDFAGGGENGLVNGVVLGACLGVAYAEKSAAAVAEIAASADSLACHTAPLWPRNVPILKFD